MKKTASLPGLVVAEQESAVTLLAGEDWRERLEWLRVERGGRLSSLALVAFNQEMDLAYAGRMGIRVLIGGLTNAAQFLPAPPPSLSSPEWTSAFNEVEAYGGANSTVRTVA